MSYANNLCHKAQLSVQAYLVAAVEAADPTLTLIAAEKIFAGMGDSAVTATRVVCTCRSAENEESLFEGNWMADMEVMTRAPASDTTEAEFHLLCSEIWAHFFVSEEDLLTGLSNATVEFTAFKVYVRNQSWDIEAGGDGTSAEWVSRLMFQIKCCGSVVG